VATLQPFYKQVQAHYDLSNDFFALFLDPSMTYSCAYFEPPDVSLEQAQRNKIDLALGKLDLKPGHRLLDIGCGWGATVRRAIEHYGATAVGLTLSRNQHDLARERLAQVGDRAEIRLQGWEEFDEPVDRIVSIGAFEHFGKDRWDDFFAMAYKALPDDGVMLLHTITALTLPQMTAAGLPLTFSIARFVKFILTEIFPGGYLPTTEMAAEFATRGGFTLTRTQSLQKHYARTLDTWSAALEAHKDEAIAVQSEEVYDRYMHYLTGCAKGFHEGYIDVCQFTLAK
jgi:cyclopropane-fatty-acyl-phospholipid synthase